MQGTMAAEDRLLRLERQLVEDGSVSIVEAAVELGVSEMTIRRDLAELEGRGTAKRVRGGAKAVGPQTFSERRSAHVRAKNRIAAKLAEMVPTVGFVAFDASSTVMRVAPLLDEARDLTVLTNGPDTFAALQGRSGVTALLTGGRLDPRTGSLVGPLACRSAAQLVVQQFVTSAAAVDETLGASETTLDEAEVKRHLAAMAAEVILAVNSSKLRSSAVAIALEWDRIDVLVTELDPDDKRLRPFAALARIV
jgi:DeoR family fructose operon transcriptional repressor